MPDYKIAPSILSADFARLGEEEARRTVGLSIRPALGDAGDFTLFITAMTVVYGGSHLYLFRRLSRILGLERGSRRRRILGGVLLGSTASFDAECVNTGSALLRVTDMMLPGISGLAYDLTSKPPGTIEWE